MNYAQSKGRATLETMTTAELKKKLIEVIRERESIHYLLGWLEQSYIMPVSEDIDRAVAINELKRYEATK